MRNLNIKVTIPEDRRLVIQLPEDVEPGEARLMLIPTHRPARQATEEDPLADFPVLHVESWPQGFSFRREEIYGDDGR
jgi:hypothetical protein